MMMMCSKDDFVFELSLLCFFHVGWLFHLVRKKCTDTGQFRTLFSHCSFAFVIHIMCFGIVLLIQARTQQTGLGSLCCWKTFVFAAQNFKHSFVNASAYNLTIAKLCSSHLNLFEFLTRFTDLHVVSKLYWERGCKYTKTHLEFWCNLYVGNSLFAAQIIAVFILDIQDDPWSPLIFSKNNNFIL